MKKIILPLVFLLIVSVISCSDDDSESTTIVLNGTSWIGTGDTISGRSITFTSTSNYTYDEPGSNGTTNGTYTFSKNIGVLIDSYGTVPFSVNNELLIINYDEGTDGYIDTEGTETFTKQ